MILFFGSTYGCHSTKGAESLANDIECREPKGITVSQLSEIWQGGPVYFSKSETDFNGEITTAISIMITKVPPENIERRDEKISKTKGLVKKDIKNFKDYTELRIANGYISAEGERNTSVHTIKISDFQGPTLHFG